MDYWMIYVLNGITFGALLFLFAAGLSVTYGLMRILNMAHGSYYLLGGYIALTIDRMINNFPLAIIGGSISMIIVGVVMQRFFLQRVSQSELAQVLMSFGFLLVFSDLSLWLWGGSAQSMRRPPPFDSAIQMNVMVYPSYRLFVLGAGLLLALGLWYLEERTGFGAKLRAAVDDQELARGLGINVPVLFTVVFALGALLAALAGVLGAPFLGLYRSADIQVLLFALVVIIVGGLGSIRGAFLGAMVVGIIDTIGKGAFPDLSLFTLFVPLVVILVLKPTGLFGREAS